MPVRFRRISGATTARRTTCPWPRSRRSRTPCRRSRCPRAPPAASIRCRRSPQEFPQIARLPVSIRIVLEAVLRHCDGRRVTPEHVRELANWKPVGGAQRGDPVRRRPRRAAGLHRRAAAVRPGRHAHRGRQPEEEPEDDRAAGAGRPRRRPQRDDRRLRAQELARHQHEDRVPAQQRALQVHEVGHAGVRHLRRRAAGLRHRPPGQPRVPGARRAQAGGRPTASRRSTTPTRWWAPTATPR